MLGYLSVKDMARRTALSEERIRQLIRTHQIKCAIKLGGWLVKEEDFDAFIKSRLYSSDSDNNTSNNNTGNNNNTNNNSNNDNNNNRENPSQGKDGLKT